MVEPSNQSSPGARFPTPRTKTSPRGPGFPTPRTKTSPRGPGFRAAVEEEKPLQVAGAINAYTARLAEATGFRALYLSGGGVAANSLGVPDLGISTMERCV